MIKRLSDEEIAAMWAYPTSNTTSYMQMIQVELLLRILDALKEKQ